MTYGDSARGEARSHVQAGLRAHQAGHLDQAVAAYRQALSAMPGDADALNLLGTALLQLGTIDEAVGYLEHASRRQRDNAAILGNLGQAYLAAGRHAAACDAFRKASRIAPREAQFQVGVAAALALQSKLEEAESVLSRLATRFPSAPLVWLNLGNVLRDRRKFEPAIAAYRKALDLEPAMVDARNAIGSTLHTMCLFEEAAAEYRACIETAPDALIPRYNLASVLMDLGRFKQAEEVSRDIAERAPDQAAAHRLIGTAISFQGRLIEALLWYRRAAEMAPDDIESARAYGAGAMETGHAARGMRWLAHAAAIDPNAISVKQVTAGALLAQGCLQDGWSDYAHRPGALDLRKTHEALQPVQTLPEDMGGRNVCVVAEQGLGDELFFLRYLPPLIERGASVSYRPGRKLHSLLARVPALSHVVAPSEDLPRADDYILAGDLPHALGACASTPRLHAGTRVSTDPALTEFGQRISLYWPPVPAPLRIDPLPERLAEAGARLAQLGPPPYVGVTWRAGTAPDQQAPGAWQLYKSITLQALARGIGDAACSVIALQRNPEAEEIKTLSAELKRPVHDLTALNDDLESMLALLALIDEYVGVSNTNMHLRAAAGRTARVLVPAPAEWRWMQHGRTSPWFPGFSIYRQSLQGVWTAAVEALRRDLRSTLPGTD